MCSFFSSECSGAGRKVRLRFYLPSPLGEGMDLWWGISEISASFLFVWLFGWLRFFFGSSSSVFQPLWPLRSFFPNSSFLCNEIIIFLFLLFQRWTKTQTRREYIQTHLMLPICEFLIWARSHFCFSHYFMWICADSQRSKEGIFQLNQFSHFSFISFSQNFSFVTIL